MNDSSTGGAFDDPTELATFVTTDIAGITRGRSFAAADIEDYLRKGVGWVPANLALTPFDLIADPNPWGSAGDLRLMADAASRARVTCLPDVTPLHFYHCDITDLKGEPWDCCVRSFLKATLAEFERDAGLKVVGAVEQEFQILGADWPAAPAFGLRAQRRAEPFGPLLMTALKQAGVEPEMFLPEYGKDQFEITCRPAAALAAADRGATIRAVTREVAALFGWNASFAPKTDPDGLPSEPEGLKGRPEADNLVGIYAALSDKTKADVLADYSGQQFSVFKPALIELAVSVLAPITEEMRRLTGDTSHIDAILRDGGERANARAKKTMKEVRDIIGFLR